jgi:hypothetical protein
MLFARKLDIMLNDSTPILKFTKDLKKFFIYKPTDF